MMDDPRINVPLLKQEMAADELDVLVAASQENFTYVTQTSLLSQTILPGRLCFAVVPRDGTPSAFVCYCEELQMREDSWIEDIDIYVEFQEDPAEALAGYLKDRGFRKARIGIEKRFLAVQYVERLAESLPDADLIGADRAWDAARAVKTSAEIEVLTDAALATERALQEAFEAAHAEDTEKKVADDVVSRMAEAGAASIWITLAVGENTAINHPPPGPKPLTRGEILRVDVGGAFEGYQSDVARTAAIGGISEEQRSVYVCLREAQRETISAARPGTRACDLYSMCTGLLEQSGLSMTSQSLGHSLGIGMHEFPVLHGDETAELQPGMVLCIEPAVKDSRGFLYHLEDLFVVTEHEPKILTTVMDTEELFVIK